MLVLKENPRGPNMVCNGLSSVEYIFEGILYKINILPTKAQENNNLKDREEQVNALNFKDAMKIIDDLLKKSNEVIYVGGDCSMISYYLNLAKLPKIYPRNNITNVKMDLNSKIEDYLK
jgi:hypothetical protein